MNERNKIELAFFAKMAALFVWGIIAIITFAGVLNYCPEGFVKWCAGILLAINAVAIGACGWYIYKQHSAKVKELQDKNKESLKK